MTYLDKHERRIQKFIARKYGASAENLTIAQWNAGEAEYWRKIGRNSRRIANTGIVIAAIAMVVNIYAILAGLLHILP